MNYQILMTRQAEADFHGIFEYISVNLHSAQNAIYQFDRLERNIAVLKDMPERFKLFEKEPWRSRNLHVVPVDNYLVFYIPDKNKAVVNIIRIMYGGRNVEKELNGKN